MLRADRRAIDARAAEACGCAARGVNKKSTHYTDVGLDLRLGGSVINFIASPPWAGLGIVVPCDDLRRERRIRAKGSP